MSPDRCPQCGLLFPLDVCRDVRIRVYCQSAEHWDAAGVDSKVCTRNVLYLIRTFVPLTVEERAADVLCRRMLAWLESYPSHSSEK